MIRKVLWALTLVGAAASYAAADVLAIEQTRIDVGPVPDTEPIKRGFRFTNISQRTVKVAMKRCSFCPKPECDKEEIAPGESAVVIVELPTMGKHGDVEATADVSAAGVPSSNIRVTLAARVRPLVRIDPPMTSLAEIVQARGADAGVTVVGRQKDFAIKSVECDKPWVTATIGPARRVEDLGEMCAAYDVTYRFAPGAPLGEFTVKSRILTSDPRRDQVGYSIEGTVVGDLVARPDHVTLGAMRPGRVFRAEFELLNRSGDPLLPGMLTLEARPMHGVGSCVLDAVMGDEPGVLRVIVSGRLPDRALPIFDMPVIARRSSTGEEVPVPIRINVRDDAR